MTSGMRKLKKASVPKPTWPPTMEAVAMVTPMPTSDAMVLNIVNVGRWLGSLVRQVWPERVQEVCMA